MTLAILRAEMLHHIESVTEEELFGYLRYHDDKYHNGEAELSDSEYDPIKRKAQELYPTNPYFNEVGAPVRTGKEKLPTPMGSLTQLYNGNDLINWIVKYEVNKKNVLISSKLDGFSCLLVYSHGILINAFSRGNGTEGASVYRHIRHIPGVPKKINTTDLTYIRGEVILKPVIFEESYKDMYRNPRNMVSGCMNATETPTNILADFIFIAHEYVSNVGLKKSASYDTLSNWGFTVPNFVIRDSSFLTEDNLVALIKQLKSESDFELDGIVVTIDDLANVRNQSKSSSLNPEHSFKFKISDDTRETTVKEVYWELSKSGWYKPTVILEPVELNGVTIQRASGYNGKFIVDMGLAPGVKVIIRRSGDVIPEILESLTPSETPSLPPADLWEWRVNDKGEHVECVAKDKDTNPEVIFKSVLDFFVSLQVEHFKEASLEKIFEAYNLQKYSYENILYFILDLTEIEFTKILGVNGGKIYNSLHRKLENITMPILLGSTNFLGVGFGVRKSEIILSQVSFEQLKTMTKEQIAELDGFDVKTAVNVVSGLPNFITFMDNIKDYLKFKVEEAIVVDADSPLSKVNVVMTGFRDDELEKIIKQSGGKVASGVSKKVTHVIAAGKSLSEGSGKTEKAVALGIPVISPDAFREMFNI